MGKKMLILLEHLRVEHTVEHRDGNITIDFLSSGMGALLKRKLKSVDINMKDVDIEYVFPEIPEPKSIDNRTKKPTSYKDIPMKSFKPYYPKLDELIVANRYDMVIPTGRMGCKYLLDNVSITKLRGVPEWKEKVLEDGRTHSFWVFPMFSMEYIDFKRNAEIMYDADLSILKTYIEQGDRAFKPSAVEYEYIDTIERVREYFSFIKTNRPITSWDLETNTLRSELTGAKALVISVSHEETQGVTIPLEHKEHTWSPEELKEILAIIKDYVADVGLIKALQNGGYDIKFLMNVYDFKDFKSNVDIKVAYYLTVSQEESKSFRLTDLAYEMTDMGGYDKPLEIWKTEYLKQYKEEHGELPVNEVDGSNFNYEWFPLKDALSPYASGDVDATLRIHNVLDKNIQTSAKWVDLYYHFYPRLAVALAQIEANGFKADETYMGEMQEAYTEEKERILVEVRKDVFVQQLEDENRALYEEGLKEWQKPKAERDTDVAKLRDKYKKKLEFNPNSNVEKGRLLFDIIGAQPPISKDTLKDSATNKAHNEIEWGDYKTDASMLEWIRDNIPEAENITSLLLEFSTITTLLSTFVTGLSKVINPSTGTVHGSFNATGTSTSRLSSSRPNLQNIPKSHQDVNKFDYYHPIKRLFTSRFEDGSILQADYSALEMRVLGLAALDEGMTEAFLAGKDLHKNTASIVFEKPEEEVTKDERQASKAVSFG